MQLRALRRPTGRSLAKQAMSESENTAEPILTREVVAAYARGLAGACLGAVLGYLMFKYLVQNHGLVVFALPGALVGLGRSILMHRKSWAMAMICAAISLAVPIGIAETDFNDGVSGLTNLSKMAIFFSGAVGFYLGLGRLWSTGW